MTKMTMDHIALGLELLVLALANNQVDPAVPPNGFTVQQWAYVKGIASAQIMTLRDRVLTAAASVQSVQPPATRA